MHKQTHCVKGHELVGDNVYIAPKSGARCCLQCKKEHNRDYAKTHRISDAVKQYRKDWYERTGYDRNRKYGLSPEDFAEKLAKQDNKCACCGDDFTEDNKPNVDHDHDSQTVRELLCQGCNMGIGHLQDSSARAAKAVEYLKKWSK